MYFCFGVDYVSVIEGVLNGNELLFFFEEVVGIIRWDGFVIFEWGDIVIMDNCFFYYGRFIEMVLRNMFVEYGVNLLFQFVYFLYLNMCEFCFYQIKVFFNCNQMLVENEIEIVIYEVCSRILL